MPVYRMFLFGVPRLERESQAVQLHRRKTLALLSYLAVTNQPHSRETLASLFWPDYDTSSALANLRRDLSRLREVLDENVLIVERDKVQLAPEAPLWLDIHHYQTLVKQFEDHSNHEKKSDGSIPYCQSCAQAMEEAIELYSGGFMAGFSLPDCPAFDDWQFFEMERLRNIQVGLLRQLSQWSMEQRSYEAAIEFVRRWLALDPLHEQAHRRLMQLYAWTGQPTAAVRHYQGLVRMLDKELEVEPEPETKALFEAIHSRRLPLPEVPSAVEMPDTMLTGILSMPERFSQEDLLVVGGFGEVFRGRDRTTGLEVAIKRLKPELINQRPEVVTRFLREAEALSRLSHPNIVRLLASFERDGQHYIVMEYMPGGTLRDLLDQTPQPDLIQVLDIALELADALSRAHHVHILHRDLKPENIIFDQEGRPRLIDFGLALLEEHNSRLTQRLTQEGMVLGSPLYMSPEALRGQELDPRSDIWSFGIILYEMLAGRPPFQGEQMASLVTSILNSPLEDLRRFRPEVPQHLVNLIQQMLVKEPEKRASSMRMIAAELEAIRESLVANSPAAAGDREEPSAEGGRDTRMKTTSPAGKLHPVIDTSSLPAQPTPFVGREAEIKEIGLMLENPQCRLLSLCGTGGIGKTRLAVEVASRFVPYYRDGIYFVSLSSVSAPQYFAPAVARILQIRSSPGVDPQDQLFAHLRGKEMLLILDYYDHLIDDVEILTEILRAAPGIKLVITSRERLNLQEEWVYEVEGLTCPNEITEEAISSPDFLEKYSAVKLFVQRARRIDPTFSLSKEDIPHVARICQLVEGMPLALELAAPWVRSMTCEEIAQEVESGLDILSTNLRNLPERHRSVRVVFQQSWERLTEPEQAALACLSIFQGGCTREAANKVTGARPYVLAALVDKAILRHRSGRFDMNELVRQFAFEKLQANHQNEKQVRARHHKYYLSLLGDLASWFKSDRQYEAVKAITADIDNVRWGWLNAILERDMDMLAQASEGYWLYNEFRGLLAEGEAAFHGAAAVVASSPEYMGLTGFLLAAQGCMISRQWRLEAGREIMERGIALIRKAQPVDRRKEAFALVWLSFSLLLQGRYQDAIRYAEESLACFPETGDRWTKAAGLQLVGASALYQGQLAKAHDYLEQCRVVCREIGDIRIQTYAAANLGAVHFWYGEYQEAKVLFDEANRLSRSCNDRLSYADALCDQGQLFLATGEYHRAIEAARDSMTIYQEVGRSDMSIAKVILGSALRKRGELAGAEKAFNEGLNAARSVYHRPDEAAALEGLGCLAHDRQDYTQALEYFNTALEIWKQLGNEPRIALISSEIGWTLTMRPEGQAAAYPYFAQALRMAIANHLVPIATDVFVSLAQLLIRASQPFDALPLLQMAVEHPATTYENRMQAVKLSRELKKKEIVGSTKAVKAEDWILLALNWEKKLQTTVST